MPRDVTLEGPKVRAERGETADAGGGRIRASAGNLSIQGAVRGRELGPVDQLGKVVFRDHRGRESEWTFGDGTRWTLRCETDALLSFSRDLARQVGRPSLVVEAPDPTAQLVNATRERKSDLMLGAVAIAAIFAVRWLVGMAAWLGYTVAILALVWLIAAAIGHLSHKRQAELGEEGPKSIAPLAKAVTRAGAVVAWFLPVCVIGGALLGIADAGERNATEAGLQERRAAATAAQAVEQAEQEASATKRRNRLDEKVAAAKAAMKAEDYEAAAGLLAEAKGMNAEHPQVASLLQALTPKLEASRAARREADVVAGVALARRVTEDRVLCEAAKAVSDAWAKLKQTQPQDATYEAALKLVPKLEKCRKRVVQTFSASTRAARAQGRQAWTAQMEQELRKRGVAAVLQADGRLANRLIVELEDLSEEVRSTVMDGSPSLSERAAAEGFLRLTLRAGRKQRVLKLKPAGTDDVARVLKPYGLATPLSL